MKIKRLFIRNLNSLRGEHEIKFDNEPLAGSGLFAITGPTGSGKSTLLDALSLALYGKVPRLGDITKATVAGQQALLTRHTTEARAEVEYQCEHGLFRSWWQIQVNRNGNLNDYEMGVDDLNKNEVVSLKKSEVPDFNAQQTGLNFEQFGKAVLLAQGDFARFLKAGKHERTQLLETITGAGIYRKLGQKAYAKGKAHAESIKTLEAELALNSQGLLDEAAFLSDCRELERNLQKQEALQQLTDQLRQQIRLKEQHQLLETSLAHAEVKYKQAEEERSRFNLLYGHTLAHYRKLIPLMNQIRDWQAASAMAREKEQMFGMTHTHLQALESQYQSILQECERLLKKSIHPEEAPLLLDQWYQEWLKFRQKGNDLRIQIKTLSQQAIQSLKDIQIPYLNLKVQEIKEKVVLHLEELAPEFERLSHLSLSTEEEADLALEEAEQFREHLHFRMAAEERKSWFEEKLSQITGKKVAIEEKQAQLLTDQQLIQHELALTTVKAEAAAKLYEQERLMASLVEHRHKLKPGEECPLCGALEHPFVVEYVDRRSDRQKEYETTQVEKSRLQRQQAEAEALMSSYKQQIQQLELELGETNKQFQQWTNEFEALNQAQNLPSDAEALAALKNQTEVKMASIRSWKLLAQQAEKHRKLTQKLDEMLQLDALASEAESKCQSITELADPTAEVKRLSHGLNALAKNVEAEAERRNLEEARWKEAKIKLEEQEILLEASLKEQGFSSREEASKTGISPQEYLRLDGEEKRLNEAAGLAQAALVELKNRMAEQIEKLDARPLPEITQALNEATAQWQEYRERQLELYTKTTQHREAAERVALIQTQLATQNQEGQRWVELNQLIGDAQGAQFARFASELTLVQLLRLANVRLRLLNPRYSLDLPADKEPEDLLIILDHDMGDSRRSVKTLSGGETFLLSLSLALALSDLAASKVRIGSLFIDEGFGSLDPETLDQTLDILEKLQSESDRTIGIISHIEALKERIRVRIDLKRLGNGYSKVVVTEANAVNR